MIKSKLIFFSVEIRVILFSVVKFLMFYFYVLYEWTLWSVTLVTILQRTTIVSLDISGNSPLSFWSLILAVLLLLLQLNKHLLLIHCTFYTIGLFIALQKPIVCQGLNFSDANASIDRSMFEQVIFWTFFKDLLIWGSFFCWRIE